MLKGKSYSKHMDELAMSLILTNHS